MAKDANNQRPDVRETRVVIYMTEADARFLDRLSRIMGFRGRSEMIAAILERLILGGFAVTAWFKTGWQFMKRMEETGAHSGEMYFGVRPLPALPVEDDPTPAESRKALAEIREELKHAKTC